MNAAEEGEDGDTVGSLHLAATRDGEERLGEVRVEDRGEGRGERDERDGAGDAEEDRGVEESRGGLGERCSGWKPREEAEMEIRAREGGSGVAAEEASRARRGTSSRVARDVARDARLAARSTATGNERIASRIRPSRVGGDEGRRGSETEILDDEVGDLQLRAREGGRRSAIPRVPGADEVEAWEGGGGDDPRTTLVGR